MGAPSFLQGGWHWSCDPIGRTRATRRRATDRAGQPPHRCDELGGEQRRPLSCVSMARADRDTKPNDFSETKSPPYSSSPATCCCRTRTCGLLPASSTGDLLAFGDKGCVDFTRRCFTGRRREGAPLRPGDRQGLGPGHARRAVHFVDNIRKGNRSLGERRDRPHLLAVCASWGRMAHVNAAKNAYEPS